LQVKILNKLASARASGISGGSKVLTDLVEGLEEPAVAVELRLKIDQNHADLKGGYVTVFITYRYLVKIDFLIRCCGSYSSFRDYGEAVLKHLENITESDPKLQKAPVNYEGVSSLAFKSI